MTKHDRLYRYLFKTKSIRGELVTLNDTYNKILENHDYPDQVKSLLAEALVATSLLTATLKFDGEITLQLQGDGPVKMVVISGNNHQQMRGIARVTGDVTDKLTLKEMMGNGHLTMTITPDEGEPYQGIVNLLGGTVSECLEDYFIQSEQVPTRLFIRTGNFNGHFMAGGMLLQTMPSSATDDDGFEHLSILTETIKAEELFNLDAEEVLYRLYNQEEITLFETKNVCFQCTCSYERSSEALFTLSQEDLTNMQAENAIIDMHCGFCGKHYRFDTIDIESFRSNHSYLADSSLLH